MLLQSKDSKTMIEVMDLESLFNPLHPEITGRIQEGEEEQAPQSFEKKNLGFLSGEDLPRCWMEADYQTAN